MKDIRVGWMGQHLGVVWQYYVTDNVSAGIGIGNRQSRLGVFKPCEMPLV